MNTHADKTQENKSQSVSAVDSQMQSGGESTFQFVDNRPEAVAQRKLQEIANNSPQVKHATQLQAMADNYSAQQQPIQNKENNTSNPVVQRVVSTSGIQYAPAAADLALINVLDGQIGAAETAAQNDVQNNPAPAVHTAHQAAYMANPTAAGWGNCVEEKLNIWAGANGWNMANNSGGSNPDYSRIRGGTKIWADLTTAAEAGAGASHIIGKLTTKVNSGENDITWVAADVVHQGLNPAGAGQAAIVPNGIVSQAQKDGWQLLRTYQNGDDYDPLMDRRQAEAENLPSYPTFTQVWDADRRETFRLWIDGSNDGDLPEEESSDDEMDLTD